MTTQEIFYRSNLKRLHDIVGNDCFILPIKKKGKFNPNNDVYSKPINYERK